MANKPEKEVKDPVETTDPKSETMEISKSQLNTLIKTMEKTNEEISQMRADHTALQAELAANQEELSALRKNGLANPNQGMNILKKITARTMTVKTIDDKIVTGFVNKSKHPRLQKFIYKDSDPSDPSQKIDFIDLILEHDEKNPVKMVYTEYMTEVPTYQATVIRTNDKEVAEPKGPPIERVELKDYSMTGTGIFVENEVIYVKRTYDLKLETGREITLDESMVNHG